MSIALENKLFYQFKQNDYILFNIDKVFTGVLSQSSAYQRFKASWDDLKPDPYLLNGGTFRLRRYAVVTWQNNTLQPMTAEAHFQSKQYNPMYGGIQRVFAPIMPEILYSDLLTRMLRDIIGLFTTNMDSGWKVQCHQFRIKTSVMEVGRPTPEGIHQDGADYVFIMLLERQGITGGKSELFDQARQRIAAIYLQQECDAILLNDKVLWHNVTNIQPAKGVEKGHRDVLVLTFHRL